MTSYPTTLSIPLRSMEAPCRLSPIAVPDMLTSLEVMSETSPSLPNPLQVEDAEESVNWQNVTSLQTGVMRDMPFRMSSSEM
ncbi:hypothetical protein NQZ68_029388 [Dissostichus eleginoides]|nr:hypothetical protein NQZ68_029388 [Dissostichus eleginoides]